MIDKLRGKLLPWQKVVLGFGAIVLCTWFLHLYTTPEARAWQNDSEALVWGKIIKMETGEYSREEAIFLGAYQYEFKDMWMNEYSFTEGIEPEVKYAAYNSQTGAQGFLFYFLTRLFEFLGFDNYHIKRLLWILNTSVFVGLFILLCKWIAKEWGKLAGGLAFSLLAVSYWLTLSISNLYWVTWTILAPVVVVIYWCDNVYGNKKNQLKWGVLLAGTFVFRFMCGFEFVSTIILCGEFPVVYYFFKNITNKEKRIKYFRLAVIVGLIAVLMFAAALFIWYQELRICSGQTYAVNKILETIAKRTGVFQNMTTVPNEVTESLSISRFQVVAMYLQSEKMWGILGIKELVLVEVVLKVTCCLKNRDSIYTVPQELFMLFLRRWRLFLGFSWHPGMHIFTQRLIVYCGFSLLFRFAWHISGKMRWKL